MIRTIFMMALYWGFVEVLKPKMFIVSFMGFESQQAVYKWQRGESLPSVDNLYALSRLFGTTMDDILVGYDTEGAEAPSDKYIMNTHSGYSLNMQMTKLLLEKGA